MQDFDSSVGLYNSPGSSSSSSSSSSYCSRTRTILLSAVVGAVALTVGVLAGYYGRGGAPEGVYLGADVPSKIIEDADPTIQQFIMDNMNAENIGKNLR